MPRAGADCPCEVRRVTPCSLLHHHPHLPSPAEEWPRSPLLGYSISARQRTGGLTLTSVAAPMLPTLLRLLLGKGVGAGLGARLGTRLGVLERELLSQ